MPFITFDPLAAASIADIGIGAPLVSTGKTFKDMQDELGLMLASRSDVSPDRIKGWINDAYKEMATELDLEELHGALGFDTVSGVALYSLPSSVWSIENVGVGLVSSASVVISPANVDLTVGGSTQLSAFLSYSYQFDPCAGEIEYTELDTFRVIPYMDPGYVRYYTESQQMIAVYPVPSVPQTIVVDAWFRPQPLVNDTDSPMFEIELHRGIILKARAIALDALLMFEKAILANNTYKEFMKRRPSRKAKNREKVQAGLRPAYTREQMLNRGRF